MALGTNYARIPSMIQGWATLYRMAVIAVHPLSRTAADARQRVSIETLSESGSIESDADVLIALESCNRKQRAEAGETVELTLHVLKQSNGPTGATTVLLYPATGRIVDIARGS